MVEEEVNGNKKPGMVDISSIDIYPILGLFIDLLSTKAWQYIGLRIKPATKKIEKDLSKASITIDCIEFLIEKLESQLNGTERGKLRSLLTDLQINFVRQSDSLKTEEA